MVSSPENIDNLSRDDFATQVHDALSHLYDPVYLQTHSLARMLREEPGTDRAQAGQALRQRLIEAIEGLRPDVDAETNSVAWRGYRILNLRYVEGLDIDEVQQRLTISKSTYYRASQQALQAVTSVLRASWLSERKRAPRESVTSDASPSDAHDDAANRPFPTRQLPIPLTSFLGREHELATVLSLLRSSRLVTLTGAPGTGKTRLAIEVASRVAEPRDIEVLFVPLASVADPGLLLSTIAQVATVPLPSGQSTIDGLAAGLGDERILLVLDNFEQIVSAAPDLLGLLARCPGLQILATSRVRLHVRGEREVAVAPLELPVVAVSGGARQVLLAGRPLLDYAAVALFVERARDTVPEFSVTDETASIVVEICHRLDGLPLAIELAAARVKLLPPALMLARLERRLPLLIGGPRDLPARQQTLRSAIAWSYDLLEPRDQKLLRQLAVFVGGASLEAIQMVYLDDTVEPSGEPSPAVEDSLQNQVLDRLESLVRQSLVVQSTTETSPSTPELRFSLLETIREYALERLAESGAVDDTRHRHAAYFLSLAEQAEPHVASPKRGTWVSRLEREHANLEAAMEWWISQGDVANGLRMASALVWFWALRGHLNQGRDHVGVLLATPTLAEATSGRAHALQIAATLAHHQRDFAAARALQEDSLRILRRLGNQEDLVTALSVLGNINLQLGDYPASREAFQEILGICEDMQDYIGMSYTLSSLAIIAQEERDYTTARALHQQCLEVCRVIQFTTGIAVQLHHLALIAEVQRDFAAARDLYEQSLEAWQADDDKYGAARALLRLASTATAQGDYPAAQEYLARGLSLMRHAQDNDGVALALEQSARLAAAQEQPARALRLAAAADRLRERIGIPAPPNVAADLDQVLSPAKEQLGDRAASAVSEGESLTIEQAIALATSPPGPR